MSTTRTGTHKYYKGKYFIGFYDKTGEELIGIFNNVRQILQYKNMSITRQNVNMMNVELYRALKGDTHFTKMLDGTVMTVYIFDDDDYDEDV